MDSSRQTFSISSPPPIASFDWNDLYHRSSLVACLVQGVYTMARDELENRQGSEQLAHPWWESFSFTLHQRLIDLEYGSIYGAVFQSVNNYQNTTNSKVSPRYVIAFRGTIKKQQTLPSDVMLNIRFVLQNPHHGARSKQVIKVVQKFVAKHGNTTVWIAGHSLGAGLALLAGKAMAISESPVEAYIFNPPISAIPLEQLAGNEDFKFVLRFTNDIVKAGLAEIASLINLNEGQEDNQYREYLASWKPHLFVNQSDPISSEYIGYFKYKVKMADRDLSEIEKLASYSFRNILFGGGESSSSSYTSHEHLHSLPSAFVIVNNVISPDFRTDHGIHQWWNPMLRQVSYEMDI